MYFCRYLYSLCSIHLLDLKLYYYEIDHKPRPVSVHVFHGLRSWATPTETETWLPDTWLVYLPNVVVSVLLFLSCSYYYAAIVVVVNLAFTLLFLNV